MIFSTLSLVLAMMVNRSQAQPDYTVQLELDKTEFYLGEDISISFKPTLATESPLQNVSILLLRTIAKEGQVLSSNTAKLLDIQSSK